MFPARWGQSTGPGSINSYYSTEPGLVNSEMVLGLVWWLSFHVHASTWPRLINQYHQIHKRVLALAWTLNFHIHISTGHGLINSNNWTWFDESISRFHIQYWSLVIIILIVILITHIHVVIQRLFRESLPGRPSLSQNLMWPLEDLTWNIDLVI